MTATGIKDLIHTLETELKQLRNERPVPSESEWESPSLERIQRKMAAQS